MNNVWRVFSKFRIHPLFWLVVALSIITANFWSLLALASLVLIHELGHAFMASFFSWRIRSIQLLPFGGVAEMEEHGNRPMFQEWLVVLAGPVQHVWIAGLLYVLHTTSLLSTSTFELWSGLNIVLLCFNLLPIWPLDGGKIVFLLLCTFQTFVKAHERTLFVSLAVLFLYVVAVLFVEPLHMTSYVLATFLAVSLWKEWKYRRYVFIRFLLERYYGKKQSVGSLQPLRLQEDVTVYEALTRFKRGKKHTIQSVAGGQTMGHIDENELLHVFFAENLYNTKVKDLIW
ncbi:M50 family metallopeptidase [Bacillus fonticola]|uniref:M50 family metallopeptidase n=1 Tax=Bacillus fonticola TaxID=2728853 RepID=UPI0014739B5C|nr:M50 family metallopeptidase [Bacillus fonticola]